MKNELNPAVGLAFREIEFRELFHAGDEGGAGRNGAQRVGIRLTFHGARVGVHGGQKHEGKNRGDQREQRKVGEIRGALKSEMRPQPNRACGESGRSLQTLRRPECAML